MISLEQVIFEIGKIYTKDVPKIKLRQRERVCVTGAGGTIGSALCRELHRRGVKEFLLIDQSEFNLYSIHRELVGLGAEVTPTLGSYGDVEAIHHAFKKFRPTIVYHAGAYKHVPLCEVNWKAAFKNNVLEAHNFFRVCAQFPSADVVVISSDKAVNPTSFMGATKLMVEHVAIEVLGEDNVRIVRFGNVLGSSGSVVPLFYQQLLQGSKVTITHEGITRYFMTVEQASALVINCSGMIGTRFLLNMGEPVKIFDLAKNIASLMGKPFQYEITGLRKGEKMYEELTHDRNAKPLQGGDIYVVNEPIYPHIETLLGELMPLREYDDVKYVLSRAKIGWYSSTPQVVAQQGYSPDVDDCFVITPSNNS